jgi:hypothetical protein
MKKPLAMLLCVAHFMATGAALGAETPQGAFGGHVETMRISDNVYDGLSLSYAVDWKTLQAEPELYFNAIRRGVPLPGIIIFELIRLQVALNMGMGLQTYLYGDIRAWLSDYREKWYLEHGDSRIQYGGAVNYFGSEEGGYALNVYSVGTGEFLGVWRRTPEEMELEVKRSLLLLPYTFSRMGGGSKEIEPLMERVLGIRSVDALLAMSPLEELENEMRREEMNFLDISYNWAPEILRLIYETMDGSEIPGTEPGPPPENFFTRRLRLHQQRNLWAAQMERWARCLLTFNKPPANFPKSP